MTRFRLAMMGAVSLALAGCISFGDDPPPFLLTLTPEAQIAAGSGPGGEAGNALTVLQPDTPNSIAVTRVPVQEDASTISYLQNAVWVDRPSRLFQQLLVTTIRGRTGRLVFDENEARQPTGAVLRGSLREFGYDARSGSVVVTFDAIRERDGQLETRRFTANVPGVLPEAAPVGAALNDAANQVALDVANWVGG